MKMVMNKVFADMDSKLWGLMMIGVASLQLIFVFFA